MVGNLGPMANKMFHVKHGSRVLNSALASGASATDSGASPIQCLPDSWGPSANEPQTPSPSSPKRTSSLPQGSLRQELASTQAGHGQSFWHSKALAAKKYSP